MEILFVSPRARAGENIFWGHLFFLPTAEKCKAAEECAMGKRKSKKQLPGPKTKKKLATLFNCPFCNSNKSVSVNMERERETGTCNCTVCGAKYSTAIHMLSESVDVYSEWIDACEDANRE